MMLDALATIAIEIDEAPDPREASRRFFKSIAQVYGVWNDKCDAKPGWLCREDEHA